MSARITPTKLARRKLEEARERDPGRQVVVRHRTVDSIGKMMHAGTITPAMHEALLRKRIPLGTPSSHNPPS